MKNLKLIIKKFKAKMRFQIKMTMTENDYIKNS